MTNSEIAKLFDTTSKLLTLHGEEEQLSKQYAYAFQILRKTNLDLGAMDIKDIAKLGRIGTVVANDVKTIISSRSLPAYDRLHKITPRGIQELLSMKGLGPKTLKKLWGQLDIGRAEDLLFACRRDELIALKGFGKKSQEALKERLVFFISMRGYNLLATMERIGMELISLLQKQYPNAKIELTGKVRRKEQILKRIDILHTIPGIGGNDITSLENDKHYYKEIPIVFHYSEENMTGTNLLITTGPESFVNTLQLSEKFVFDDEQAIFDKWKVNYIPAEIRHQRDILLIAKDNDFSNLITVPDIRGSLHMHTTDSDGIHTLEQMVKTADDFGYEYMLITDHSKSAGYANGLSIDRLISQINQIKILNEKYRIKIYTGIESDILTDGALDYPDDILAQLDIVIASVHSGLNMDIQTATDRVLKAIYNPYTKIMGHLTGRLLTQRAAYPLDHKKILDACAETGTVMELNANPSRLDMDERHIQYAMQKGVKISINPDAHSTSQLPMMQWGVNAARRGGLTKDFCLNAQPLIDFDNWVNQGVKVR